MSSRWQRAVSGGGDGGGIGRSSGHCSRLASAGGNWVRWKVITPVYQILLMGALTAIAVSQLELRNNGKLRSSIDKVLKPSMLVFPSSGKIRDQPVANKGERDKDDSFQGEDVKWENEEVEEDEVESQMNGQVLPIPEEKVVKPRVLPVHGGILDRLAANRKQRQKDYSLQGEIVRWDKVDEEEEEKEEEKEEEEEEGGKEEEGKEEGKKQEGGSEQGGSVDSRQREGGRVEGQGRAQEQNAYLRQQQNVKRQGKEEEEVKEGRDGYHQSLNQLAASSIEEDGSNSPLLLSLYRQVAAKQASGGGEEGREAADGAEVSPRTGSQLRIIRGQEGRGGIERTTEGIRGAAEGMQRGREGARGIKDGRKEGITSSRGRVVGGRGGRGGAGQRGPGQGAEGGNGGRRGGIERSIEGTREAEEGGRRGTTEETRGPGVEGSKDATTRKGRRGAGEGGGGGNERTSSEEMQMVVVTGSSVEYWLGLQNLVGSIRTFEPNRKVVIYNLGLQDRMAQRIRTWCRVELRWTGEDGDTSPLVGFSSSELPEHLIELRHYAWKPLVIKDAIERYGIILWLDAGSTVYGRLKKIEQLLIQDGHFLVWGQDTNMAPWVDLGMFRYFNVSSGDFEGRPSFAGNTQGYVQGGRAHQEIIPLLVDCALHIACIAPSGSSLENHRYDQAALSVIVYSHRLPVTPHTEFLTLERKLLQSEDEVYIHTSRNNMADYAEFADKCD